MQIIVATSNRN